MSNSQFRGKRHLLLRRTRTRPVRTEIFFHARRGNFFQRKEEAELAPKETTATATSAMSGMPVPPGPCPPPPITEPSIDVPGSRGNGAVELAGSPTVTATS